MAKLVYNSCFGGFSLSREAVLLGRKLSSNPTWGGTCIKGDVFPKGEILDSDYGHIEGVSRDDPILVAVVEQLGKKANGAYSNLQIAVVEKGTQWRIDEYDGNESVMTQTDYEWYVAKD